MKDLGLLDRQGTRNECSVQAFEVQKARCNITTYQLIRLSVRPSRHTCIRVRQALNIH